jgi:hypothetical protein
MVTEQSADEENSELRYKVRLLIHHPNIDPDRITEILGLTPQVTAKAGSVRKAPNGVVLPGLHKFSVWSHSFRVEGHRHFFTDVEKMIDRLEPHKTLLNEIASSGGSIYLIVDMPGDVNLGSTLGWRYMARLFDLHIDLGIEVFPDMH